MATSCRKCSNVWVPPRLRCPLCFSEIDQKDWVEVGPEGTLQHFTIVYYESETQPLKPPFAYGIIQLDGATRGFTHLVYGTKMEDLHSGMRLMPVFSQYPQGGILDIEYFTPTGGQNLVKKVGVVGLAQTSFKRRIIDRNYADLVYEVTTGSA